MRILMLLGWRNLLRRKWRTAATGAMLFTGAVLLVFLTGMGEGTYAAMVRLSTNTFFGDFQILHSDYNAKPGLYKNITQYKETGETLKTNSRVKGVSYRVEAPGLISRENLTMGGLLLGIQPGKEVTSFVTTIKEGQWWTDQRDPEAPLPLVMGSGMAARLKAKLGDEITYIGQAADGSVAAELFEVTGIIDTGIDLFDRQLGLIPLDIAQELLVMEGRVHRIVGLVDNPKHLNAIAKGLDLPDQQHLLGWEELLPALARTIESDRQGLYVFLLIIAFIVLLGVANTMMMSVMERHHELGVVQSLGTSPFMMVVLVLSEILWLGLISISLGVAVGAALNAYFSVHGIPTGMEGMTYGGVAVSHMYTANTLKGSFYFPLMILGAAMIAGLPPALKAAYTNPVDALRD